MVTKLQEGDESYLFFACFIIVNWLQESKANHEAFELAKKIRAYSTET